MANYAPYTFTFVKQVNVQYQKFEKITLQTYMSS